MRRLFQLLSILILIPILSSCLGSTLNLTEGIDSFKVQDYRRAFIRLKPLAEQGQPDAQYAVGFMYYYGHGVVEDKAKAVYWIHAAARAGQPDAVEALKIMERGKPL